MKLRSLLGAVGALLISLVLFLLMVEVGVRLYTRYAIVYDVEMVRYANEVKIQSGNPRIGHVHRPGASAVLMGVPVEINADGLRDRDYAVARGGGERIVLLGDSLTFGWGVAEEQTFGTLLEEELSRHRPTEVLNFGTGNYNTEQQVNLFLDEGLKYRPDRVVVFYFINDAEPTPRKSRWEVLGHSRAFTFFWSRFKAARSRLTQSRSFRDYYADLYADEQPGWKGAREAFLTLRDVCAERGIDLKVVLLPELHQLRDYPFAAEYRTVADFLERNGIATLDITPSFADVDNPMSLWVAPDDAHPNAIAHARIAEAALAFVAGGGANGAPRRPTAH